MARVDGDIETDAKIMSKNTGKMTGDPMEFLVWRRCPEFDALKNPELRPSEREALEKKVAAFRRQLEGMARNEFEALFKEENDKWFQELRSLDDIIYESLDFMHPMHAADPAKWGSEASWTIEEAGALMIGRDPDSFPWDRVYHLRHSARLFRRVCDFRRSALRTAEQKQWKQHVPPAKLIDWAAARGFEFPPELVAVVHAHEAQSSFEDDLNGDKLSLREIGSLYILVIAMAITCYRYDPFKPGSHGATEMQTDVEDLKMKLKAPTITKLLHRAAEKVDSEDVAAYFKENPIKPPVRRRRRHSV
ncbi:MAG TPA: hypothetical protein VIF02_16435 [Methylocella sp.]